LIEYFTALPQLEQMMLIGAAGALLFLPLKDILSVEFYDVCDIFLSMIGAAVLFGIKEMPEPSVEQTLWVMAGLGIAIIFIKIFIVVPFQRKGENSSVLSRNDYIGMEAEVTVSISPKGIGEIMVKTPFGRTTQMAKVDNTNEHETLAKIPAGTRVQVTCIKDSFLYVVPIKKQEEVDKEWK